MNQEDKMLPEQSQEDAPSLDYSIIIPAYNEEDLLPTTLACVAELKNAAADLQGEVIVVDNNSTDHTAQIARDAGATVVDESINQISRARNAGARAAKGKYLFFLDADTVIPPGLFLESLDNLQSGKCCGGGAIVTFEREIPKPLQKFADFWNWLATKEGLAAGSYVYCLRDGFEHIGGFSEKVYAGEEVWFSKALRRWGKKQGLEFRVVTQHQVVSSARKMDWHSSAKLLFIMFFLGMFPFLSRSKWVCSVWYDRPQEGNHE